MHRNRARMLAVAIASIATGLACGLAALCGCGRQGESSAGVADAAHEATPAEQAAPDAGWIGSKDGAATPSCAPGTRDYSFGSGGDAVLAATGRTADVAYQRDGKLVVAGTRNAALTLARIDDHGALDSTYGNGGFAEAIPGETAVHVALTSDDKAVVIGFQGTVARYTASGTLDATFGVGGIVRTGGYLTALSLLSDGRVLVGGDDASGARVWRFRSDGTPDATFADDGGVAVPNCNLMAGNVFPVAYDAGTPGTLIVQSDACPDSQFSQLWVIDPDAGITRADAGNEIGTYVTAVDSQGRILLSSAIIVRLIAAGQGFSRDPSFGDKGVTVPWSGQARAMRLDPTGNIVLAGTILDGQPGGLALARYDSSGILDPSFGDGGIALDRTGTNVSPSGADLAGCSLSVAGTNASFSVTRYSLCCH